MFLSLYAEFNLNEKRLKEIGFDCFIEIPFHEESEGDDLKLEENLKNLVLFTLWTM